MKTKVLLLLIVIAYCSLFHMNNVISDPELNVSNSTAQSGNTTKLDFDQQKESEIWQGFFGDVNGGIVLEDASGISMYDWEVLEANGEVFATRYIVADWSNVNCTNQTEIYKEEERLDISNSSTDGINDTFANTTHPSFEVAGRTMTGCRSTLTDNSTDEKVVFWNILLNTNTTTTIYTVLVDDGVIGFNGTAVDYQLLVPVNKTSGQATYNFYLEFS